MTAAARLCSRFASALLRPQAGAKEALTSMRREDGRATVGEASSAGSGAEGRRSLPVKPSIRGAPSPHPPKCRELQLHSIIMPNPQPGAAASASASLHWPLCSGTLALTPCPPRPIGHRPSSVSELSVQHQSDAVEEWVASHSWAQNQKPPVARLAPPAVLLTYNFQPRGTIPLHPSRVPHYVSVALCSEHFSHNIAGN